MGKSFKDGGAGEKESLLRPSLSLVSEFPWIEALGFSASVVDRTYERSRKGCYRLPSAALLRVRSV